MLFAALLTDYWAWFISFDFFELDMSRETREPALDRLLFFVSLVALLRLETPSSAAIPIG